MESDPPIEDLRPTKFEVQEYLQHYVSEVDLSEAQVQFDLSPYLWTNKEGNKIRVRLQIRFYARREEETEIDFVNVTTVCEFELPESENLLQTEGLTAIPEDIIVLALSFIISGTRGVITAKAAGTPASKVILPIVDARALAHDMAEAGVLKTDLPEELKRELDSEGEVESK